MEPLRLVQVVGCVSVLGVFGWGMLRFFRVIGRPNALTRATGVLALGCAACHVTALVSAPVELWRSSTAIILYVASLALFVWAVRTCRDRSRTLTAIFEIDTPRYVLQDGPYRFVRHPIYLAYSMFWTGGWIASGWRLCLASAVMMTAIYVWAGRREEAKFRGSLLVREHAEYCRRTGFMFPRRR